MLYRLKVGPSKYAVVLPFSVLNTLYLLIQ